MMTIPWNGRKEHHKRQVNSDEYFNDHILIILHEKRYIEQKFIVSQQKLIYVVVIS